MSTQAQRNFFISTPFGTEQAGFYQDLLRGVFSYPQLGNRLIYLAEQAYSCRQYDQVEDCGQLLVNIPLKPYQAIGCYFLGVVVNRPGNINRDKARRLFEIALESAPDAYKSKAILSLGALAFYKRDFGTALDLYREAIRAGQLNVVSLIATRGIATVKSIEGYHQSAIADLENVLPMMRYAPPQTYFDILNSYAVELGEVGRVTEARNVIGLVLASPFTSAYPEWQQTAADLQGPSRSVVQVTDFDASPENVLSLPPAPERVIQSPPLRPGKLLDYMRYKKKIAKKKKDEPEENIDLMDKKDLLVKLLELTAQDHTDEEELRQVVKCAVEIMEKKR